MISNMLNLTFPWKIKTKFIRKRPVAKAEAGIHCHFEIANSFIMFGLAANLIVGINANGS